MRQNCPQCQRLWREYAAATTTHIGMESKLRALQPDTAAADELGREVAAAATVRETTRLAIQQHEAAAHGDAAGAGEDAASQ